MEDAQLSPLCQDGRHFQCPRWWWVMQDKVALTCECWCHTYRSFVGSSGAH